MSNYLEKNSLVTSMFAANQLFSWFLGFFRYDIFMSIITKQLGDKASD